jgi:RNA polymerase sigma factor (sigma-70 family)
MLLNMTANDLDLLRQFARDPSQDAFTALVNRHVNLVYSAALRQVRSPQLAEEIAQSVFADLAHSAPRLKPDTVLTAWLYAVTRRTAVDAIRKESRRQLREQIAVEMTDMNATTDDWKQIAPLLDEALATLDETDRTAVLLRYFENKSLREVGQTLGTTDDTAQKRVSRAVERLREFFTQRRVTLGAGGLAAVISTNAVQAAPAGLAATISATALAGTAVATSTLVAATKTIAMTTLQKTLVTATLAAVAGAGIYEAHQAAQVQNQIQTLQQQQSPLTGQIQQLQQEQDKANNQLAALAAENEQMEPARSLAELQNLRDEVARLKAAEALNANQPNDSVMKSWLNNVAQLKQYAEQHPDETIPEFQFLTDREWLIVMKPGDQATDFGEAMLSLKSQAVGRFANLILTVLQKYAEANNGQFPNDLSQLQPYCATKVEEILQQRYEIKPVSILNASTIRDRDIKADWVIAGKEPVASNTADHIAVFTNGVTYFW